MAPTNLLGLTTLGTFHTAISNPDAPGLQIITAALFVVFLIGTTLQVLRLRARLRLLPASA
jgi:predicted branched-subunit amino acid permease